MDALQQPHSFMRAPQPPMADPQPRPPPPLQGSWYSGQYQTSQPPPPFPHPHQQSPWLSHSEHQPVPTAHPSQPHHNPNPPYPTQPHHNQYPPPHHHLPPPPPFHHHSHSNYPQVPQPYPQSNQSWGSPNWAHQQGWEYPDKNLSYNNEEDWAARARAWAAANVVMEGQNLQSQFHPASRPEEHSNVYHDQYQQAVDPYYADIQQSSLPASSHQQFPVSGTNLHRPPVNHPQECTSFSFGQSSYVSDGHMSYAARGGSLGADSNLVYPDQRSVPTSSSIYQQEVPSSYSSASGKEESREQNEQLHKPLPLSMSSAQEGQYHVQSMLPAIGRSNSAEQHRFTYDDRIADSPMDPSDRPLDFAPRFTRDHDPHSQVSFTHPDPAGHVGSVDPIAAVPSIHAWTPSVAPGVVYPPVPPVPLGPQFDPSFAAPPPVTGHAAPIFGRISGPSLRSGIPTAGVTFGLGAGTVVDPTAAFSGDSNGVLNVSERPKKASVPNWLREEIIKKKAVITSSNPEEDSFQPIGDESVDKSFRRDDQADNKSIDSSRSTEDEDDDEDDVEAARTAAINQEIKRVLTEVLLKVTDELFDEIATKVLTEDDLTVEVDHSPLQSNHKVSPSPTAVPTPKASAKILIPVKAKESEADDVSRKSNSSFPGDVLGLASYASDDDGEEIRSSSMSNIRQTDADHLQSTSDKLAEDTPDTVENGSSKLEGPSGVRMNMEGNQKRTVQRGTLHNNSEVDDGMHKVLNHENDGASSDLRGVSGIREDKIDVVSEKMVECSNAFESKDSVGEKDHMKPELLYGEVNVKKSVADDSHGREARNKSDKNSGRRISVGTDFDKEKETSKTKAYDRHLDSSDSRRRDERHARKEKADERNGSKERVKDRVSKSDERAKESDSRKNSTHVNSKDDRKETDKVRRASAKEDGSRKRERVRDEKGDKLRHRTARDTSRHKRWRSSSVSSRGDSSAEASEDSRKLHSKKRSLSPSPVRSKRRPVSRSPHSKHSQRRHSPYSSLETTRGRRSRSNSPSRRRR